MDRRALGWILLILGCILVFSIVPFPFSIILCLGVAAVGYYAGIRRNGDRK